MQLSTTSSAAGSVGEAAVRRRLHHRPHRPRRRGLVGGEQVGLHEREDGAQRALRHDAARLLAADDVEERAEVRHAVGAARASPRRAHP